MRLLLFTFVLDEAHTALAWQVNVLRELAARVEKLLVVTSRVGRLGNVPANAEIVTVPVRPAGVPQRLGGRIAFNAQLYALCRAHQIEAAFIHMAINWAYTSGPMLKLMQIPVVLWYAHGTVSRRLSWALSNVDAVVTSTPEGCRIQSEKIRVIGQAIDTAHFEIPGLRQLESVLYVGRISPRKRIDLLYQVAQILAHDLDLRELRFDLVGGPLNESDLSYYHGLRDQVWCDGMERAFNMWGFVPYARIPQFYNSAFVHVNVSCTGSMDKTVMEALAAGCPVLTSNRAFFEILKPYPEFVLHDDRPEVVAERIEHIHSRRAEYSPQKIRQLVSGHELATYADRILKVIDEVGRR